MAKKLLCAKGCGKPFGSDNAWKKRHEDKCKGEKVKPAAAPHFPPANRDPEDDTMATKPVEEITLPKKTKEPSSSAIAEAIEELKEKRKARLIEVQQIDSLIQQLEAVR